MEPILEIYPEFYNDLNMEFKNKLEKDACNKLLEKIKKHNLPKPHFAVSDSYHPRYPETIHDPFIIRSLVWNRRSSAIKYISIDIELENDQDEDIVYDVIFEKYVYDKFIYIGQFKLSGDLPEFLINSIKGKLCLPKNLPGKLFA